MCAQMFALLLVRLDELFSSWLPHKLCYELSHLLQLCSSLLTSAQLNSAQNSTMLNSAHLTSFQLSSPQLISEGAEAEMMQKSTSSISRQTYMDHYYYLTLRASRVTHAAHPFIQQRVTHANYYQLKK